MNLLEPSVLSRTGRGETGTSHCCSYSAVITNLDVSECGVRGFPQPEHLSNIRVRGIRVVGNNDNGFRSKGVRFLELNDSTALCGGGCWFDANGQSRPPEDASCVSGSCTLSDDRTIHGCWVLSGKGFENCHGGEISLDSVYFLVYAIDRAILLPKSKC